MPALPRARSAAGLKADAPVKLVDFPKKLSLLEKLLKKPRNSDHAKLVAQSAAALRPVIGLAKQFGIYGPPPGVVQMTDFEITH